MKIKIKLNFLIVILLYFIVLDSSAKANTSIEDRIMYFKKILTENPKSIKAQCDLADAYVDQYITTGSTDKIWLFRAKKVIKKAEKVNDKSAFPYLSWSKYYKAMGDNEKANHYTQKALSLEPGNRNSKISLGIELEEKEDTPIEKKLTNGLIYQDLVIGKGALAKNNKTITIHYVAWLKGGKKFDSTYDRNKPLKFKLGKGYLIHGLETGIKNMRIGGKRKLIIPPHLAYGKSGVGTVVPPDSTLVFEIELLDVK